MLFLAVFAIMVQQRKKIKRKQAKSKKIRLESLPDTKGKFRFILPVLGITFLVFLPVLQNGFTNWDDIQYVTGNPLIKDIGTDGLKAILSTPVVSNYHPLTILTLAVNYHLAGLTPWSYHLTSVLLHVINTGLVFWFIMLLSGKNKWVSAFTSLLFGIHPMHVESVAWISERKDLLYTLFYLLAMIIYVRYVQTRKVMDMVAVTLLGALSLLCKPAAIVLPLSLLLLDYFFKRPWSRSWVLEKLPLIFLTIIMAYVTVSIQSGRAIASLELYSFLERICFAGFGLIWYLVKLIFPWPLSSLHPFPDSLSPIYYFATITAIAGCAFLLIKVRNRLYHFGFGFYIINLLLVLQLISIGNAVVAERYTYVPYISVFFLLSMEAYNAIQTKWPKFKSIVFGIAAIWIVALGFMTWLRIPVWKSSETLWNDVLKHYPESPRAWTNKGLIYYDRKEWQKVIDDLSNALKYDPHYANALEWRARAYLEMSESQKALMDAQAFYKLYPEKVDALFVLARSYEATGQFDEAVATYNLLIEKSPEVPEYTNNRGTLYFNKLQRYEDAKKDFEGCIQLDPANGVYFLNLSRCYYMLSDIALANQNAKRAMELGVPIDPAYASIIGLQ